MVAFFDMDWTLLTANTGALWVRHLRRKGRIDGAGMARMAWWIAQYRLALIDMADVSRRVVATVTGESEAALADECRRWFADEVARFVAVDGRRKVAEHRSRGERCVILSSSTPYATAPLGEELGMDDVISSRLEVKDGVFTGRMLDLCYGPGKVELARRWCDERGVRLADCAFYSDSFTDVPMLAAVGRPVVVNPDLRLWLEARRRGWPIERWR